MATPSLIVGAASAGYGGIAALLIVALLIATPLFGTMYVATRHGVGKVPLWFKLHFSHSNPSVAWFRLSIDERCAMRQKLRGGEEHDKERWKRWPRPTKSSVRATVPGLGRRRRGKRRRKLYQIAASDVAREGRG